MDENPYRSPQSTSDDRPHPREALLALHHCADGGWCRKTYLQLGSRAFFVPAVICVMWLTFDRPPPTGVLTAWIFLNAIAVTLALCARELRCLRG